MSKLSVVSRKQELMFTLDLSHSTHRVFSSALLVSPLVDVCCLGVGVGVGVEVNEENEGSARAHPRRHIRCAASDVLIQPLKTNKQKKQQLQFDR